MQQIKFSSFHKIFTPYLSIGKYYSGSPLENPYGDALKKKGIDENATADKTFQDINGINSSREFLSYFQKSQQVSNRPQKEVFNELLLSEYGDIVRCDLRNYPNVLLGNADYIKIASEKGDLVKKGGYYYNLFHEKHDMSSTLQGNNRSHYIEPILKGLNNPSFISNQIDPLRKISKSFTELISENLDSYTKVPTALLPLSLMWGVESAVWYLYSKSAGTFAESENFGQQFLKIQKSIVSSQTSLHRNIFSKWIPTPSWRKYCNSMEEWYGLNTELFQNEQKSENKHSFCKFLASYKYSNNSTLSDKEIVVTLSDLLSTSTSYTPIASVWLLHDIAKYPKVQEKIYEEMEKTSCNLKKSTYLMAVIKESMRLHPIQDCHATQAPDGGIVIGGYKIPEKVGLTCASVNTALNEAYFENPLEFIPERWLNENANNIHPYASAPFGIGERKCPAINLSEIQLSILIQEVLKVYLLDSDPDEIIEAQYRPLLAPTAQFDIAFNERNKNNKKE